MDGWTLYLFIVAIYSTAQNKSISMSMDPMNSSEIWLDKGISLYPNLYNLSQFTHLFMHSSVSPSSPVDVFASALFLTILDYSFFHQKTHWIRKKISLYWCGVTQLKDRLWFNLWMFCVSNEVFIIAWNISITKPNAEGLGAFQLIHGTAICRESIWETAAHVRYT